MAIIQGYTESFMQELLRGVHNFDVAGDTFKIALYSSTASLGPQTTAYTTAGEVTGAGYTAGGKVLTCNGVFFWNGTVYVDFDDISWHSSSITARGAMIYNTTAGGASGTNNSVMILDFGIDRISSPDFTITFPPADSANALMRFRFY